ncbi:hypothetical protein BN946_scf184872.g3 [Trametes cinnabarina]|uniref:Uncharacterized protein n=1 Tax=Pycnoporus cinnabarinus TaxID=5643 RepID=A0A060S7A5_PYCCI|nr:hypothetical protein BN946_scf184872.g3 [Trametes cinnabarina]
MLSDPSHSFLPAAHQTPHAFVCPRDLFLTPQSQDVEVRDTPMLTTIDPHASSSTLSVNAAETPQTNEDALPVRDDEMSESAGSASLVPATQPAIHRSTRKRVQREASVRVSIPQSGTRRSMRKRAQIEAGSPDSSRAPAPKKAKTASKSVAVPTQPGSSRKTPPAAPLHTTQRRRATRRSRAEVEAYMIPGSPCACPVDGCHEKFGASREDNRKHLAKHYPKDTLDKKKKVDCLWFGCKKIAANELIHHVASKHVRCRY